MICNISLESIPALYTIILFHDCWCSHAWDALDSVGQQFEREMSLAIHCWVLLYTLDLIKYEHWRKPLLDGIVRKLMRSCMAVTFQDAEAHNEVKWIKGFFSRIFDDTISPHKIKGRSKRGFTLHHTGLAEHNYTVLISTCKHNFIHSNKVWQRSLFPDSEIRIGYRYFYSTQNVQQDLLQ